MKYLLFILLLSSTVSAMSMGISPNTVQLNTNNQGTVQIINPNNFQVQYQILEETKMLAEGSLLPFKSESRVLEFNIKDPLQLKVAFISEFKPTPAVLLTILPSKSSPNRAIGLGILGAILFLGSLALCTILFYF